MRVEKHRLEKRYIIDPGEYYVSDKPVVISTLLGSCVAACLFDGINKVMAMNHFLLTENTIASKKKIKDLSEVARYGIHAMEMIINGMLKLGAEKKYLKAKAFGGGNVLGFQLTKDNFFQIGEKNIQFIKEFLTKENIPLISSDLGGNHGRVIHFFGSDYSVYVRKIGSLETSNLINRDEKYWKKYNKEIKTKNTKIELWNS